MGLVTFCIVRLKDKKQLLSEEYEKMLTKHNENDNVKEYIRPCFKELTQEQINNIHSRGKITSQEKVKEWEDMGLCAPGDAIGSAAWRCKKFHYNCHDCLVDYANGHEEYISFYDILKTIKPY